jgi:hypothetical protein
MSPAGGRTRSSDRQPYQQVRAAKIEASDGGEFEVLLSMDGGSNGSVGPLSYVSWTYTVTDPITGRQYGTQCQVWRPRPFAGPALAPATKGKGALKNLPGSSSSSSSSGPFFTLVEAYEQWPVSQCSGA